MYVPVIKNAEIQMLRFDSFDRSQVCHWLSYNNVYWTTAWNNMCVAKKKYMHKV